MHSQLKFLKFDYLIVIVFLTIFIFACVSLYNLRLNLNENNFNSIGKVVSIKNNVMKKNYSMLTWRKTDRNDSVLNNDEIFADQDSMAHIKLNNGSDFFLNPGSSIRIDSNDKITNIHIPKGAIGLRSSEANKFMINHVTEIEMKESSSLKINQSPKSTSIDFLSGKINVINNNARFDLSKLKSATLDLKGNKMRQQLSLIQKALFTADGIQISLNNPNHAHISISLSPDLSFNKNKEFTTSENQINIPWNGDEVYIKASSEGMNNTIRLSRKVDLVKQEEESIFATMINEINVFYMKIKKNSDLKKRYQHEKS